MFVVGQDFQPLTEQARLDRHGGTISPSREGWRNVELDLVHGHLMVGAEVFAFEIGVDRHLQLASSTDRRDEVDGHDPAPFAKEVHGFRSDIEVHTITKGTAVEGFARDSMIDLLGICMGTGVSGGYDRECPVQRKARIGSHRS